MAGPPDVPVDPAVQAVNDQLAACREKPADFDKWVALITAAEKLVCAACSSCCRGLLSLSLSVLPQSAPSCCLCSSPCLILNINGLPVVYRVCQRALWVGFSCDSLRAPFQAP